LVRQPKDSRSQNVFRFGGAVLAVALSAGSLVAGESYAASSVVVSLGASPIDYPEQGPPVFVAQDAVVSSTTGFADGFIEFSVSGALNQSEDVLRLSTSETPGTGEGEVSVVGNQVFLGLGDGSKQVGTVDSIKNGLGGQPLRVNFSASLENADFTGGVDSNGHPVGWTVNNGAVVLGALASRTKGGSAAGATKPDPITPGWVNISGAGAPYTIEGLLADSTPYSFQTDFNYNQTVTTGNFGVPNGVAWSKEGSERPVTGSLSTTVSIAPSHTSGTTRNDVLLLTSRGNCQSPNTSYNSTFCSVFGPEVLSAPFEAKAGDDLSFWWSAVRRSDDYEIYAFLVNTVTNDHTVITYGRGGTQPWVEASGTIPADGTYQFRFVNGSYDRTGGYALGSDMFIDNVRIVSQDATADVAQAVARLLQFESEDKNPEGRPRTLEIKAQQAGGANDSATRTIVFNPLIDDPVVGGQAGLALENAQATQSFSNLTGDIPIFDPDSQVTLSGVGATSESFQVGGITYTQKIEGEFGVLWFEPVARKFLFEPNNGAINSQLTPASETFEFLGASESGNVTGQIILSISITPSPPVLTDFELTPGNQSLSVTLSPPSWLGGSPVQYEYRLDETDPWVGAGDGLDFVIAGLVNGDAVGVEVRAVNASGESVALGPKVGVPAAPPPVPQVIRPRPLTVEQLPIAPPVAQRVTTTIQPRVVEPGPLQSGPVLRNNVAPTPPPAPTAIVGGTPTTVQSTVQSPTNLALRVDRLNLGISVQPDQGLVRQDPGGQTEVQVRSGTSATLQGSGVAPRSVVQVFMPLQGDNAKEITRIQADAAGNFSGEALFATALRDAPIPIGRQVLQMVTVDEEGRQAVVELTVNIAQPPPSPEIDRELGDTPALLPGQSLATNAGVPIPVTVIALPDDKQTRIEGDGWSMAVDVNNPNAAVEETEDGGVLLKLVRDETAQVSGSGFMPLTRADIWLFSEPTLLGTVDIDENGEFNGEVNVDGRVVTVGEHTLQLQGVGTDGYVRAANLGVLVGDEAPEVVTTAEQAGGFFWWLLLIALVVISAIVALFAWLRRKGLAEA
jgi:hypothetical protein